MSSKLDVDKTSDHKHLQGKVLGDYKLLELIGTGTYGCVYKAVRHSEEEREPTDPEQFFAIKVIKLSKDNMRHMELVEREINVFETVESKKSSNIVSYKQYFNHCDFPCVVMEYCDSGTLYEKIQRLKENDKLMRERDFIDTLKQIVDGVEVLHDMNIIHRDLKTKNILLTSDDNCKIADFGVAKLIEITGINTARIGTPFYMCPEILQGKPYDQKADIFSLGCSCYEMATGKYAFDGTTFQEVQAIISSGKLPATTNIEYSDEIKDIILQMLSHEPARRPTIKQVKQFLKDYKHRGAKSKKKKKHRHRHDSDERKFERKSDSGVGSSGSCGIYTDPRVLSQNKELLEIESSKLQSTLITEIKSHKAADIVSYIKSLQKQNTPEEEFQAKVTKHIGQPKFQRLYPLMQAMKCIEDGRRNLQTIAQDTTIGVTYSNLES